MGKYSPLKVTGMSTGLVQNREEFLLPDDAYPVLQNAYVWREKIKRKKGYQLLGRLQRSVTAPVGNTDGSGNFSVNLVTSLGLGTIATLVPGAFTAVIGANTYSEPTPPNGTLLVNGNPAAPGSFINWASGTVGLVTGLSNTPVTVTFSYYPNLPVMGIRTQELMNSANDQTIFFDQKYAYIFNSGTSNFQEFIPGTTWNAHGATVAGTDFFWSTNYWVSGTAFSPFGTPNSKLFWVTNNTGQFATPDPIRITDGTTWVNFQPPTYGQIDAAPTYLVQCLAFLPFRGRLVTFNTYEGPNLSGATNFPNRIRWSTIGNPFIPFSAGPPATGSWRDDIRGQGGFLDIPTSEDIVAVGFVRDNLVIYCERSTWQLRYTGRSIAPFQIERVNSELGAEGTFSAVQFDTSLLGIGDKGIVECDSYKSERIDIKIPDLVFNFNSLNNGVARVQGIRDFPNRLAYWTIPLAATYSATVASTSWIFPNQRLVYNYENDSWALFNDSLTALGTYQTQSSRTWLNTKLPWVQCNFPWINQPQEYPSILGGNQQGFVEYLDELTTNDVSLFISGITANTTLPTVVVSPNHNMSTGFVIGISGIPSGTPFANLNGGIFGIVVNNANSFQLYTYNSASMQFSTPQLDVPSGSYIGGGLINIRENFNITSKKFNFLDDGQSIQIGYIDILMNANSASIPFSGVAGNTDSSGNFLANLNTLFGLPAGSTLVPGSFTAVVGSIYFVETNPPTGNLLVNDIMAPAGSFVNSTTTSIGLVTGLPTTPVNVNFLYYPGTPTAEISLNVFLDYNDTSSSNTLPQNSINNDSSIAIPDTFFNSVIPTSSSSLNTVGGRKFWQRVYCPTRANFLTIQYTFSNAQLAALAQEKDVQIDAQVIWLRRAGRMCQI